MYRTTNIGIAAWLLLRGYAPAQVETDPVTRKLVVHFEPSNELSSDIHRYRYGDGPEETTVRSYNAARTQLSTLKPNFGADRNVDGGHE